LNTLTQPKSLATNRENKSALAILMKTLDRISKGSRNRDERHQLRSDAPQGEQAYFVSR
jgi:hypothetical protein